jgi:hypothetical protein
MRWFLYEYVLSNNLAAEKYRDEHAW